MPSMVKLILACLMAWSMIASARVGRADELRPEILKKVRGATAFIKVSRPGENARGSGFFISPEIVVTNAHVLGISEDDETLPERVEVVLESGSPNESVLNAQVQSVNVERDLAYLKVPRQAGVQPLTLRPSKEITETLPVYILGFPLGEGLDLQQRNPSVTISTGHVSSLRRDAAQQISQIQIDGSLIPGNSGGPIIDAKGELIAVSVAAILGLNIGFSIPGDMVQADLDGRIASVDYDHAAETTGSYAIKARVRTIDPLGRIKRLALYYWTSRIGATRPPDPQGSFGTYGAPGDGPRKHVELALDRQTGLWVGQIDKIALRSTEDFWIQPAAATAQGVRRTESTNQGEFLRRASVGAPEPSATAMRSSRSRARTRRGQPEPTPSASKELSPRERPSAQLTADMLAVEISKRFIHARQKVTSEPIVPSPDVALTATRETDAAGLPYAVAKTRTSSVSLGDSKLLEMVPDPSGRWLFVLLQNQSKVFVLDPADMSVQQEIPVPRQPVSVWCDAERLAVACDESRLIAFIDLQSLKLVGAVRLQDDREMQPCRVLGRLPNGSMVTIWRLPIVNDSRRWLCLVSEDGQTLNVKPVLDPWCVFLSADLLWQGEIDAPYVHSFAKGQPENRTSMHAFGRPGTSIRTAARSFLSDDGQRFIIPAQAQGLVEGALWGDVRTLVVTPDLKAITQELDGTVLCEYSAKDCYVAWKPGQWNLKDSIPPEVMYYSRATGRMFRKIIVDQMRTETTQLMEKNHHPVFVFVPGHELLLVRDRDSENADVVVVRCGPVEAESDVAADPTLKVKNAPPKLAVVGRTTVYTPIIDRPAGARSIVFRIDGGLDGMQIDSSTGKITFVPTQGTIGSYEILVMANIDGIDVPAFKWRLDVDAGR